MQVNKPPMKGLYDLDLWPLFFANTLLLTDNVIVLLLALCQSPFGGQI